MNERVSVLFAEDEPALGQIVKESLETRNFHVQLVEDGDKALKAFHEKTPQVLVLDVMMPKKDGFTVAKEIRQLNAHIPIIFSLQNLKPVMFWKDLIPEGMTICGSLLVEELIVRINNLLNRKKLTEAQDIIILGDYLFDFSRQTLKYKSFVLI